MCELGSQGGMDGRWHCSAAQVEILLFKHADILLVTLALSTCIYFFLPISVHLCPLLCQHALLIDREKMGTKKEGEAEGRRIPGHTLALADFL